MGNLPPSSNVERLLLEFRHLASVLPAKDLARFAMRVAQCALSILQTRTMVSADKAMRGTLSVQRPGGSIVVPISWIDEMLAGNDDTSAFGAVREMYAGNVYLREFSELPKRGSVVDLGSNRGLFMLLAARDLQCNAAIGVEPMEYYGPVFAELARVNDLPVSNRHRITALISSHPGADRVTMTEIIDQFGLTRISFLKCDVEGAEYDVFQSENQFLECVDNLAMELHPDKGDNTRLAAAIEGNGMTTRLTGQFGESVINPQQACYLYASREGLLRQA